MSDEDISLRLSTDSREIQPTSLNHVHITNAINHSQDLGGTLQFSKLNISDVGVEAAEELATIGRREPDDQGIVQRLALDHNRLATLPMEFALLSRLRYLNLKHNNFSIFPDVLTVMPSLDTLDISYNKIKRFPSQPGRLVQLRVLSISRNKISRLPTYLSQFHGLDVLHIDRNPIEWPPKIALEISNHADTSSMKTWIRNLQAYLESGAKSAEGGYLNSNGKGTNLSERYDQWRFPFRELDSGTETILHSRTLSVDSTASSIPESLQAVAISKSTRTTTDRPPPLRLGMLQPARGNSSSPASFDGNFSSPADSDVFEIEGMSARGNVTALHSRATSEASPSAPSAPFGPKTSINFKESLLDIHSVQPESFDQVFGPELSINDSYSTLKEHEDKESDSVPPPRFTFQDGSSTATPRTNHNLAHHAYIPSMRNLPSMSSERNLYFRRLSSLPAIALPKPMESLMESARTILFVLCQVYNAIEHYAILAIDERLASVLRKVLDPANADMLRLIRAFDRFDTTSRKMLPSSNICRDVVESCRDAVAAFIKALGVLTLQLRVISVSDDVRYTRWITLELYAAIAEISYSWQIVLPQIDGIRLLLQTTRFPSASDTPSEAHSASVGADDIAHDSGTAARSTLRMRATDSRSHAGAYIGRARTTRRHAGSFSSKDVEIGKKLPSYEEVNGASVIISPSSRLPRRVLTPLAATSNPSPVGFISPPDTVDRHHSHNGSHSSMHPSLTYSPLVPLNPPGIDISKPINQVDKETLQAISSAIEIGPSTWDMIENALGEKMESGGNNNIQHLRSARSITKKLSDHIRTAADSDACVDRKSLHDDARSFLKVVIQLSNMVKAHVKEHEISPTLRSNMEKLTNSTEEFAILLHVSSFTPTLARPQSPMYNTHLISEDVLGSSLSRISRNPHTSSSGSGAISFPSDGPRSALPTQSFKIPTTIRRLRSAREARIHPGDPG
ncbi:RAM signaling pathway protein-domain-containing protein [Cyathus striatus]|nr:RAM signaling pathway protein-domain-containing protein [Cyathus striatus]